MRFAKLVFLIAGLWGFAVLTPLYFLFDRIGASYPPPMTHPDFYYGFIAVALVWQAAFLVISRDPERFRPMMVVAIMEKFSYVVTLVVLYAVGGLQASQAAVAGPDLVLGILFILAFHKTSNRVSERT